MKGKNRVNLLGSLGRDPEVKTLDSGVKVARVSIATNSQYKDKTTGEKVDRTEWHNLVFWRSLAEVVEKYLKKGSTIDVEGSLATTRSESDGVVRYHTNVIVRDIIMLNTGNGNNQQQNEGPIPESTDWSEMEEKDDLPF